MQLRSVKIEQARKAKRALNSLHWSIYVSVNTKKLIFYTVIESILRYGWEIWTLDDKFKEKLISTKMDFSRRTARMSETVKSKKWSHQTKYGNNTNNFLERMKNNMLKCYGHVVCIEDNKISLAWLGGRQLPKVKWDQVVMKHKSVTSNDAIIWQLW